MVSTATARWVLVALALALLLLPVAAAGPRSTSGGKRPSKPALGFNHCSIECCGPDMPSAAFLKGTADAMVRRGLTAAGYEFVNMVRTSPSPPPPPPPPAPAASAVAEAFLKRVSSEYLDYCSVCHACPARAGASGRLLDDAS